MTYACSTVGCCWWLQDGAGGSSSIQEAAGQGDLTALQALLASGAAVNETDESSCSALHFAADRGQLEAVQVLLAAGADINAADADGQTPLHYAAMCGYQQVGEGPLSRWSSRPSPSLLPPPPRKGPQLQLQHCSLACSPLRRLYSSRTPPSGSTRSHL